ncbi:sensor domain-containing diguanylate cyclase [Massilia sp. DD77]|uniref:sensor domain-containing diguanylate cyclase n=1 Tax=Massilia sp. DD77 TaxID=3109349 RepID=UPI002FFEDD08
MRPDRSSDPHISSLTAKKRPAVRYVIGVLVAFCMLLIGFVTWDAWHSRQQRLADTATVTANMALALATQGEGTIRVVDSVLAGVVERIEHDGMVGTDRERLRLHLRNMVTSVEELHGLFVYGADGGWVVTSLEQPIRGNNSDREYFRYHRVHKDRSVHVGLPVRSRSSGVWVLPVSRRLDNPDGSFAGVVLGTIRVDYFSGIYERFDTGAAGTIVLMHDEGRLIYRHPFDVQLVDSDVTKGTIYSLYKRSPTAGTAMIKSYIDGVERLYSYRHFDGFPLIVATAQSKDEILAKWWRSTSALAAAALVVIALLCGGAWRLVRQIMIRDRLEQELVSARAVLQQDNRELAHLADNDALTGIANRRRFEHELELEKKRAGRSGKPLSLVMVDVDYFKKYNDTYGHVQGDECLRQVAAAIRDSLGRPTDLAARYGGEEFAVLLPDTDPRGARNVAEHLRLAVMRAAIPHSANPPGVVTVSAGVCTMRFATGDDTDATLLVERADALLYRAKQTGRNRVRSDEDEDRDDSEAANNNAQPGAAARHA